MNIKQALKEKNRMIGKINKLTEKIRQYNLFEEGQQPLFNSMELYREREQLLNEMIDLKTRIHIANAPMYHKIFRLSELKDTAKKMDYLRCSREKEAIGNSVISYIPTIDIIEKEKIIEALEKEIESIQEELDAFNQTTYI
jgi:hypothetical protein